MKLGYIACALGRHRVDEDAIKQTHGYRVGRCRRCSTPLEELSQEHWAVPRLRDAGLNYRL